MTARTDLLHPAINHPPVRTEMHILKAVAGTFQQREEFVP